MNEEWKDIPGYEEKYAVSSLGNVKSIIRGVNITGFEDKGGYLRVFLYKGCKRKRKAIHRLVAEAFIPNPYKKDTVNHIDCNKLNNASFNLEWCSIHENITHAISNGIQGGPKSLLTEDRVREIRASTLTQAELGRKYNVDPGIIWRVIHRKIWKRIN